ncbi:MAG: DUF5658 family protein [Candidatus Bathyarchaeia archaeon]
MAEKTGAQFERLHFFKLWLVLFPILNAVDIVQTWLFFEHETNPLYVLFPTFAFWVKILWSFFIPFVLYFSYPKKPKVVYGAALALVLLYLGVVLVNSFNIMRILSS